MERLDVFARSLLDTAGDPPSRPRILAVDGRSGSGKTTLADRLCQVLPGAAVVHTDDVAWAYSRFGWDDLMLAGILAPLHAGRDVHYPATGMAAARTLGVHRRPRRHIDGGN